jgi:hypothetical protein
VNALPARTCQMCSHTESVCSIHEAIWGLPMRVWPYFSSTTPLLLL